MKIPHGIVKKWSVLYCVPTPDAFEFSFVVVMCTALSSCYTMANDKQERE